MTRKRHICVIGLGEFGQELARQLAKECEVLAIDHNESAIAAIMEDVQRALIMDVRDFASLSAVITADFDEAVVSMGETLEASILATLHLRKIGVRHIWAKANSEDHAAILKAVGASEIVFAERETARRLAAQIVNPNLLDFIPLEGDYRVMDVAPPNVFYGKTLLELDLRKKYGVFVLAIKELIPTKFTFLPSPTFIIKPSDILVMIGLEKDLMRILELADS